METKTTNSKNQLKHKTKFNKKNTNTKLISTEFVVLDKDANLKGTFQTEQEAITFANNKDFNIYMFKTYSIKTTQKIK